MRKAIKKYSIRVKGLETYDDIWAETEEEAKVTAVDLFRDDDEWGNTAEAEAATPEDCKVVWEEEFETNEEARLKLLRLIQEAVSGCASDEYVDAVLNVPYGGNGKMLVEQAIDDILEATDNENEWNEKIPLTMGRLIINILWNK